MLTTQELRHFMDLPDFVATEMGLPAVAPESFRLILLPTFHPEEVWDVAAAGRVTVHQAAVSVRSTITQLMSPGPRRAHRLVNGRMVAVDVEPPREVFTLETIRTHTVATDWRAADFIAVLAACRPEDCRMVRDGIAIECFHRSGETIAHVRLENPEPSDFTRAILATAGDLGARTAYRSQVGNYFPR